MSATMEEENKRWTARLKSQLVPEIIQGRTTVSEASRQIDLPPPEPESWVDEGKRRLENALRAKPEDVRKQFERQFKELQKVYGEAVLELRARKIGRPCKARTRPDRTVARLLVMNQNTGAADIPAERPADAQAPDRPRIQTLPSVA